MLGKLARPWKTQTVTTNPLAALTLALTATVLGAVLPPPSPAVADMPEHPKPGPQHQHLAQMVGTWDAVMTMPDGQKAVGVMTYKSDLNGFWLLGSYKCDFLGQPFQGHAIDGYDQSKNKYVSIWVDSMSSWPMVMDGDLDEKTKTLTVRGQGPGCDGKTLTTFQCVTVFDSPDTMKWKMETIDASGKATLMMSTVYSRRKADTPTK